MKAEELMIGDWVLTLDSTHKEKIFAQVNAIEEGKQSILVKRECSNWFVDIDWIEPIFLTTEILEKNGWEETPTGYVFYTDGKRYDNSLWYIFGSNAFVVNTAEFQIKYVHELQHALMLCRIKKEIIL